MSAATKEVIRQYRRKCFMCLLESRSILDEIVNTVPKSFHGDGSLHACVLSCHSTESRSVLAIHAVQKFDVIFCESHKCLYSENNKLLRKLELSFFIDQTEGSNQNEDVVNC